MSTGIVWAEISWDDLALAIKVMEETIERTKAERRAEHQRRLPEMSGPGPATFTFREMGFELHQSDIVLPQLLRRSLFITAYSTLEHELDTWATKTCEHYGLTTKPADLKKDKGVGRSSKYFARVVGIAGVMGPERDAMLDYGKVRNAFAHCGAIAKDDANERRQIVKLGHLEITDAGEIWLYPTFCEHALRSMFDYTMIVARGIKARDERPADPAR